MASSEQLQRSGDLAYLNLYRLQDLMKEHSVPDVVRREVDACLANLKARDKYCETMTSPSSAELNNIVKETRSHPWEQLYNEGKLEFEVDTVMLSGHLEGKFLKSLVRVNKCKRVLEVGLFTGSAALSMAEALPVDGIVVSLELDDYLQKYARELVDKSPHGKKIIIKGGPAKSSLEELARAGEKFDFVFLDADKEGYIDYYNIIMDNDLLSPGGIIAADNTLDFGVYLPQEEVQRFPEDYDDDTLSMGKSIKEFNEMVYQDNRVNQIHIEIFWYNVFHIHHGYMSRWMDGRMDWCVPFSALLGYIETATLEGFDPSSLWRDADSKKRRLRRTSLTFLVKQMIV